MLLQRIESTFRDYNGFCEVIYHRPYELLTLRRTLLIGLLCGVSYGFIMGFYNSPQQAFVSALKVPILFYATLGICMTLLHFIGILFGSKLKFIQTASVLIYGISVSMILLTAFAPISLFFMLTNSSYQFILLMHVCFFGISGAVGLYYIRRNFTILKKMAQQTNALAERQSNAILSIWIVLYMFVGTQMAYILSPFVGSEKTFMLFNGSNHNFYTYLFEQLIK
jgi:hypothetical protein